MNNWEEYKFLIGTNRNVLLRGKVDNELYISNRLKGGYGKPQKLNKILNFINYNHAGAELRIVRQ